MNSFPNLERIRPSFRLPVVTLFADLQEDLNYALRSIRRHPGLATATVLTLALGLGLNVSVFTVLWGLLFRARVDVNPESFIHLSPEYTDQQGRPIGTWTTSVSEYRAYASATHTIQSLAAWSTVRATFGENAGEPQLSLLVSCNFFDVYGLQSPLRGRIFTPAECEKPGEAPVLLIGESLWKNQFASDPSIIGKTVRMNGTPFSIMGVLPAGFAGRIRGPGIWIPWTMQRAFYQSRDLFQPDSPQWLNVEGRLAAGRTRAEAQAELAVIAAGLDKLENGRRTTMRLTNGSFGDEPALRSSLFWLAPAVMGALLLILLIACTNVTVLQLSRAVTRRREMGIRLSLGATRNRLLRMLLTEMLLLSAVAGAISAYIANQAPSIFTKIISNPNFPAYQTRPDPQTFLFLGAIVLAATILAGLSPAAESLRVDLHSAMKPGDKGTGGTFAKRRDLLVSAQVAMSLILLVSAVTFLRAQHQILDADPGYDTRQVLFAPLPAAPATVIDQVGRLAGIEEVAVGSPLSQDERGPSTDELRLPGQTSGPGNPVSVSAVSSNYFQALRIPLLTGRTMETAQEAVASQSLVQSFWPRHSPIGERVLLKDGSELVIVGVARDIASKPGVLEGPHLYRRQDIAGSPVDSLLVRFRGNAAETATRVQAAIDRLTPGSQVRPRTLRAILDELADRFSPMVSMVGVLAGLAFALALLGIHGVVSFAVQQRTKEIGIRAAIGATRLMLLRLILIVGARPVVLGIGVGLPASILATSVVGTLLRNAPVATDPKDPAAYVAVAILLLLAGLAAMLRPAWRAANIEPLQALREE